MLKNNLMLLSPFRVMGYENENIIPEGGLGAVAAQAGVGKTALLVQVALNAMLRGQKVLHISLQDPVNKVNLWYHELFNDIAQQAQVADSADVWESILPNRFIMTFKVEGFDFPKLKERMTDLMVQNIFMPQIIIIDGLKFDDDIRETLVALQAMAKKYAMRLWFTIHVHGYEELTIDEMPASLKPLADLFDVVFKLQPEKGEICIKPLGSAATGPEALFLDSSTMLIKKL